MTMPPDLSEAAQLDGASPMQFLFRVLIPLSWNTIGALTVIMFLFGWNQFLWPLILLRDQNLQVVQWGMNSLSQNLEVGDNFGPMMMGVIVTSLPPMFIFLILQRQFLKGICADTRQIAERPRCETGPIPAGLVRRSSEVVTAAILLFSNTSPEDRRREKYMLHIWIIYL